MHNIGRANWSVVRRIEKYIKQTRHYKLTIDGNQPLVLCGYSDYDYSNDRDNSKSISGYTTYLGHSLVSWSCKQQRTPAQSTTEAEYMSMAHAINVSTP